MGVVSNMKKIVLHRYDLQLLLDCVELALDYYHYNAFVRRFRNYNTWKSQSMKVGKMSEKKYHLR